MISGDMNVTITGGTGFIGSRLASACLERGDTVTVLGQSNTAAETNNVARLGQAGVRLVQGSITDPAVVADAVAGAEVVFHLAATQHEMNVPDQRFWDVNVGGTKLLLQTAARAGVRRVVHGSTIGVYGALQGTIDESTPPAPDNIYGVTKLAAERAALAHPPPPSVVAIRIPEVYGPGDRRLLKLFRAIDRKVFFLIGSGRNLHHPIFVDDLVQGFLRAAQADRAAGQVVLFAGPKAVTTSEMVQAIAAALGRPGPRFKVPLLPLWYAAAGMELTLRPLGIQPPLHRRRMDFFRKSFALDAAGARKLIGFEPRTEFAAGARLTAEWYRSQGLL
jgi:nucleoside-diphosphate-sugar epimerase